MPLKNQLVQIWIDLPGREYQETLQATPLSKSLFQIREIPFITDEVNYMDIVHCQEAREAQRKVIDIFKSSGYSTIHLMFAEYTPKELIGQCIRVLLQKGATYRRSGLRAFSINIAPESDRSSITGYLEQLKQSGMFSDENHNGIGAAEQARRHLDYLMGKRPMLQDGRVPETEFDLSGSDQSKPA
jgi:uncharacterized protein DUF4265